MGAGALHPLSRKSNNGVSVADAEEPPRRGLLRPRSPPPLSPRHSQQVSASMDSPSPQAARRRISHARQGQDACASGRVESVIQARRLSRQEPERPGSEVIERGQETAWQRSRTAGVLTAATFLGTTAEGHEYPQSGRNRIGRPSNQIERQNGTKRQMEPKGKRNRKARGTELEPRPFAFFPRHIEAGCSAHTKGDQLDLKP